MKKLLTASLLFISSFSYGKDFLPVDQAFDFKYIKRGDSINLVWNIADKYYLYKDKIKFTPSDSITIQNWPKGEFHNDPAFGNQEMFTGYIFIKGKVNTNEKIKITYQGCKLGELCYMPQVKELN